MRPWKAARSRYRARAGMQFCIVIKLLWPQSTSNNYWLGATREAIHVLTLRLKGSMLTHPLLLSITTEKPLSCQNFPHLSISGSSTACSKQSHGVQADCAYESRTREDKLCSQLQLPVVKSLVTLHQSKEPVVVTSITLGSFYERLFTSGSLHLVCSSGSQHWLSKSPKVLVRNHIPAYDIDEHARRERLPIVHEAYAQQFRKDFTRFLVLRAKELAPRVRMIISIIGRPFDGITSKFFHIWKVIAHTLSIMVSEGLIDKEKFNSFYVPMYGPSSEELRQIIQEGSSFSITEMRVHGPESDTVLTPSQLVKEMRAVFEPIIVQHFSNVMDDFARIALRHLSQEGSLHDVLVKDTMVAVSLIKA